MKPIENMSKEDISWELYAIHDYCECGYSSEMIATLPKKELVARLKYERNNK